MGKHIALEIHQYADTSGTIVGIGNPSYITHLYRRVGVDVSLLPFKRLH